MQKCSNCGAELPENSSFCGKCGSVQDAITTDAATTVSNTVQPPSWAPEGGTQSATWPPSSMDPAQSSSPTWSPNEQAPATPPPEAENEDERRRGIPPWSPLYGAALGVDTLLGSGLASPPSAPVVQGTPQLGSVPSVSGSPTSSTNAPAGPPVQGAAHAAPVSHPVQGPMNAPVSHPVQGPGSAPVSHPVQGPGNMPVSHPVQGPGSAPVSHPMPGPQPPEPPGTPEPHPPHRPHRHHDHPAHHELHRATHVTKAAGGSAVKTILIVVTAVVVVAAGGIAAAVHFLSHPQPLISITSNYKLGNTPVGANGTILHISGQQFSSNSAITLLLDGHGAPGNSGTRSDANGTFSADVTITDAWSVGTHTLTARDASNYSPQKSVSVTIVQQGQANTPGPDGAPPDDATFMLTFSVKGSNNTVNQPFPNNEEALQITGHPDPAGGTVCLSRDNGQHLSATYTDTDGLPFTETYSFSCKGSYKSGKISYTEILLTDVVNFIGNVDGASITCTLTSPRINQQVKGSYTGNGTFAGTWTYGSIPASDLNCTDNASFTYFDTGNGTWAGTVSGLQR